MAKTGYIEATVQFQKEGEKWVARCLQLGTSTYGDSLEEVEEAIRELMNMQLNALEKLGERRRFFREHRIRFSRKKPEARRARVSVPVSDSPETAALVQRQLVAV